MAKGRVTERSLRHGQTIYFVDIGGDEKAFIKVLKFPRKRVFEQVNYLSILKQSLRSFERRRLEIPYFYSKKKAKTKMKKLNEGLR